jgi:hypothetical protein
VTTELQITGKPAQFGRGVMVEVGNKLLGKFADCLADELGAGGAATTTAAPATASTATATEAAAGAPAAASASEAAPGAQVTAAARDLAAATSSAAPQATTPPPPLRRVPPGNDDAVDLLDVAGIPVLKRLLPAVGVAVLLLVVWRLLARPRR